MVETRERVGRTGSRDLTKYVNLKEAGKIRTPKLAYEKGGRGG